MQDWVRKLSLLYKVYCLSTRMQGSELHTDNKKFFDSCHRQSTIPICTRQSAPADADNSNWQPDSRQPATYNNERLTTTTDNMCAKIQLFSFISTNRYLKLTQGIQSLQRQKRQCYSIGPRLKLDIAMRCRKIELSPIVPNINMVKGCTYTCKDQCPPYFKYSIPSQHVRHCRIYYLFYHIPLLFHLSVSYELWSLPHNNPLRSQ
jgi:hypothetical protein